MIQLLDRTFSSDLLPGQVRRQRADIVVNLQPTVGARTTREAREGEMRARRGGADTRQTNETQESPGSDD